MRGACDALLLVCQADELDQLVKGESWQQASPAVEKQQVSGAAVVDQLSPHRPCIVSAVPFL